MACITIPPEILEQVMAHCSVKDLKACRLVSKLWHDSAMLSWNKSTTVQLDFHKRPWYFPERSLDKFLQFLCKNGVSQPFVNITFVGYFIEDLTPLARLFDKCASHMKTLTLKHCTLPCANRLRQLLFEFCVNLEDLTIDHCKSLGVRAWPPYNLKQPRFAQNTNLKRISIRYPCHLRLGITWMELLSHFPSLKVLNLEERGHPSLIDGVLSAINQIHMHDPTTLALEEISIQNHGNLFVDSIQLVLQVLKNRHIQLKKLAVKVNGNDGAFQIMEIFTAHSSTLKALELRRASWRALKPEECIPPALPNSPSPLLVNLKELRLDAHVFTSLAILKFTPNLRKLIIEKCSKHDSCESLASGDAHDMASVQLKACNELELGNFLAVEVLENVVQWVPNVERLKMPLDNETFALVCQSWPNLTLLDITMSKVTESGITGLDKEYVAMINTSQGKCSARPPTVPRANITSLKSTTLIKHLNTFVIGETDGIEEALSYSSLYFGLLKLSSLINVVLFQSLKVNPDIIEELPFKIRCHR